MKREIKFRGKHTRGDYEWIYGLPYDLDGINPIMYDTNCNNWYIDHDTLGQFTGLHDIHGREIYEGDIVRTVQPTHSMCGEVEWYTHLSCWSLHIKSESTGDFPYYLSDREEYEVLGNAYDNPELLRKEV